MSNGKRVIGVRVVEGLLIYLLMSGIAGNSEALQGVMGNRGIMSFISGEQWNTSLKMKGTGEQM